MDVITKGSVLDPIVGRTSPWDQLEAEEQPSGGPENGGGVLAAPFASEPSLWRDEQKVIGLPGERRPRGTKITGGPEALAYLIALGVRGP